MKQYNTRLRNVEAQQFKGGIADAGPILKWINTNGGKGVWCGAIVPFSKNEGRIQHPGLPETLRLRTSKGWEMVNIGEYIVRTEEGAFFPCDAESFNREYESSMAEVIDISPATLDWNTHRIRPHA